VEGKVVEGSKLTDRLQTFYINFIWSKNRSGVGTMTRGKPEAGTAVVDTTLPAWHKFNASLGNAMRFVAGSSEEVNHYRKAECDFWDMHPKTSR